jgi:hypothetical protein
LQIKWLLQKIGQNKNVNQQEIKIKRKIFRTNIIWHLSKMLNKKTNICIKTSNSESLIRFEYAVHQLFKALYRYTRLKYKTKVGKTGNSFIRDH